MGWGGSWSDPALAPPICRRVDIGHKALCPIREVTRIFNEHGIQVSHSKVYQIQVQRDDLEARRPNTRALRPLPKQAQFHVVGKRGERYL